MMTTVVRSGIDLNQSLDSLLQTTNWSFVSADNEKLWLMTLEREEKFIVPVVDRRDGYSWRANCRFHTTIFTCWF